ncbi:hypothetical protein T492DRAFT_1040604, partial [Pavlovales sp. CCMP2436]
MRVPKVVGVLVSGEVVAIVRSQNVFSQTVGSVSEYEIRGRNTAACREARGADEEGGSIPGSRIRARALVLGRHHAKLAVAVAHRLHDYREVALSDEKCGGGSAHPRLADANHEPVERSNRAPHVVSPCIRHDPLCISEFLCRLREVHGVIEVLQYHLDHRVEVLEKRGLAHGMGVGAVDVVGASEVPQGRAELQLGRDWPAYAATRLGARSRLEIILDCIEDHVERRPAHAVAQAELARYHLVHLSHGCLAVPPLVLLAPRLGLRLRRRCRSCRGRGLGLVRSIELQGDDEREMRAAALCVHLVGLLDPERVLAPSRPEVRPGP